VVRVPQPRQGVHRRGRRVERRQARKPLIAGPRPCSFRFSYAVSLSCGKRRSNMRGHPIAPACSRSFGQRAGAGCCCCRAETARRILTLLMFWACFWKKFEHVGPWECRGIDHGVAGARQGMDRHAHRHACSVAGRRGGCGDPEERCTREGCGKVQHRDSASARSTTS
jgi:hypothetical protein